MLPWVESLRLKARRVQLILWIASFVSSASRGRTNGGKMCVVEGQ